MTTLAIPEKLAVIDKKAGNLIKYLFDLIAAFLGLVILSPFLGIIAYFIKKD
ncbi:MAG: sugar transferase, partial [Anaerolineaceae bacterium]|nr:sugar transferase [Anaerolineaceae bacterium]